MPRYVILDHDHPFPHWDFMLEWGDRLRTWRLCREPARGHTVPAEALGVHRMLYLDYEGPLSGERGRVARWDAGTFRVDFDAVKKLRLTLSGGRIVGGVVITQIAGNEWIWRHESVQGAGGVTD